MAYCLAYIAKYPIEQNLREEKDTTFRWTETMLKDTREY